MFFHHSPLGKEKLYQGDCCLLSSSHVSRHLVSHVVATIERYFPSEDLAVLHRAYRNDLLMQKLGKIRQEISESPDIFSRQQDIVREIGWSPKDFVYDSMRLRMVTPSMHTIEAAKPAFFAHRDTWYASPEAQINIWVPLFSYEASETFQFFPQVFAAAVDNDSHCFDFSYQRGFIHITMRSGSSFSFMEDHVLIKNCIQDQYKISSIGANRDFDFLVFAIYWTCCCPRVIG